MTLQTVTSVLMIALLSACSATPRTFIAPKNATDKVAFEKAVEECAFSAQSADLSDLTKSKLTGTNETVAGAMIGAASGLGVGTVGLLFGSGLLWPVTGAAIGYGAATGAIMSASLSTSEIKIRDALILGCLGAKGYTFEKVKR